VCDDRIFKRLVESVLPLFHLFKDNRKVVVPPLPRSVFSSGLQNMWVCAAGKFLMPDTIGNPVDALFAGNLTEGFGTFYPGRLWKPCKKHCEHHSH
jgi:hypothetical protein